MSLVVMNMELQMDINIGLGQGARKADLIEDEFSNDFAARSSCDIYGDMRVRIDTCKDARRLEWLHISGGGGRRCLCAGN
jgi:hypothetical protein